MRSGALGRNWPRVLSCPCNNEGLLSQAHELFANKMTETQDVVQKAPRTEPAKSTLPQPGRPVPSRAYPGALIVVEGTDGSGKSTDRKSTRLNSSHSSI